MVRAHSIGNCLVLLGLVFLVLRPGPASAGGIEDQSPQAIVKDVTSEVLTSLRSHHDEYRNDPRQLASLMARTIAPHFDARIMAREALGLRWREATPEQRSRFMAAFKQLMIDDYAMVFRSYSNQHVEFLPARAGQHRDYATVSARVVTPGEQAVRVDYRLYRAGSRWLVYDVETDGISLLFNYRNSFAEQLQDESLDALIARIEQKNAAFGLSARS
jgi:phospholipid transport system substrate-binding protein